MKSYAWILILVLFLGGFSSCHSDSDSERYKDILRESSWYVYDIDYKLCDDFETSELFDFFYYLLEEKNLLFLPGDELMFSERWIDVVCPDRGRALSCCGDSGCVAGDCLEWKCIWAGFPERSVAVEFPEFESQVVGKNDHSEKIMVSALI